MLPQFSLVIDGTVLAAAVGMVNEAGGGAPHGDGSAKGRQCRFLVKPIAGCPSDNASDEEVDNDGKI
jgi:hypothetical protein